MPAVSLAVLRPLALLRSRQCSRQRRPLRARRRA